MRGPRPWIERAMGASLRLVNRVAGGNGVDRLKLREPLNRLLEQGTRLGTEAVGAVARTVSGKSGKSERPERLATPAVPSRFDIRPTDEQRLARDTMRRFAEEQLRPAARAADEAGAPPPGILAAAHELGLGALAVPEALGGAGGERSVVANALVAEELARGDMGLALAILAPLGVAHALVEHGTAAQQARYLPAFVGERAPAASLAILEPRPLFDPFHPKSGAVRSADGYTLHGVKSLVPRGAAADVFLVAAEVLGAGPRLFLVERGATRLTVEPEPAMGLRSAALARVRLDGVRVSRDALLGGDAEAARDGTAYETVVDRARIAWGALAVGGAQAVLDYVIPYVNERVAFGEPISHRQSVAFLVADIAIELEAMRVLVHRAASRAEHGLPFGREAALARIQCAGHAPKIGSDGVQLLGGHGYVREHLVELFYRHLAAVPVMEGALLV